MSGFLTRASGLVCASVLLAGALVLASVPHSAAATAEVHIDNFAFTPAVLAVKAGTQVTFINRDDIPHTVVSTEGKFRSEALDTDDHFEFTFTTPGEFGYFCSLHPHMTAKIVVEP